MKVLVLGLPRTGTQSLADALVHLGISPVYHMREVKKNEHQALWIEALEAKFEGKGTPWGLKEFDKILGPFGATTDIPAALFPKELVEAYPEAAVILSTRSEDAWYASMMSTIWHRHSSGPQTESYLCMKAMASKYHDNCWGGDFAANGRAYFQQHNQLVRDLGKDRKFLEFEPTDGWRPLCEFLGVPVPDEPYPMTDGWLEYKKMNGRKPEAGGTN